MALQVWYDHQVIAEHPEGSEHRASDDDLVVTEPGGRQVRYGPGGWHAAGYGLACAYRDAREGCPNCTASE